MEIPRCARSRRTRLVKTRDGCAKKSAKSRPDPWPGPVEHRWQIPKLIRAPLRASLSLVRSIFAILTAAGHANYYPSLGGGDLSPTATVTYHA